jgi:hypothetical protein
MCLVLVPWALFDISRLSMVIIWCKHLHKKGKTKWRFYNTWIIYVDDCIIAINKIAFIQQVKDILQHEFDISNEGEIHYIHTW